MRKKNYKIIRIILSLTTLAIIFVFIFHKFTDNMTTNIFSPREWNENINNRTDMIDDLLQRYDFIGMTKDEVIELLGENGLTIGTETLRYETYGGILSDEILQFIFDQNEKIISVGIAN